MKHSHKFLFAVIIGLVLLGSITLLIESWHQGKPEVYSQQSSTPTQPQPEQQNSEVTFLAMGDIMLSRNVAAQMNKVGKNPDWPFAKLKTELASTDFNFANLESPYSGSDDFPDTGSLVFNAPTWTLPGLVKSNFKVLNLANNHAFDQSKDGLLYTKSVLDKAGIVNMGTGANTSEAWEGKVYNVKGLRIGFIGASYSSVNDGGKTRNDFVARMEDTTRLKTAIAALKPKTDYIVVTMHGGIEYTRTPNEPQKDFAHAAIDDGADIVIGAHPHWIQTFETYKGQPIFYSLGNFVFDQMFSQDTKEGLMLKISLEKSGTNDDAKAHAQLKQIELLPVIIENYGQPRLANEAEQQSIFKKIGATTNVITP